MFKKNLTPEFNDILYLNFNFISKVNSASDLRIHDLLERILLSRKVIWLSRSVNKNQKPFHFENSNLLLIDRDKVDYGFIKNIYKYFFWFFGNKRFEHQIIIDEIIQTIISNKFSLNPKIILLSYLAHKKLIVFLKEKYPDAKIIIDTNDVQYDRYSQIYKSDNVFKYYLKSYSLKRFKKDETSALRLADKLISLSNSDSSFFKDIGCKNILFIPSGFKKIHIPKINNNNRNILFVGHMGSEGNVKAVLFFISEIFPKIIKSCNDVILYIVGSSPSSEILRLNSSNIKVTGYVKDISKFYLNSRVLVCPFTMSYGQRTRIYEALSHGIPCIVSSKSVAGMPLINSGVIIKDSNEKFAKSAIKILKDFNYYKKISDMGIRFSKNNLSMERTYDKIIKIF